MNIPYHIEEKTHDFLRAKGEEDKEGIVLWLGTLRPPRVTDMIIPEQIASTGRFTVPLEERQRITRDLSGKVARVIIQVHSHPHEAFHSSTDDRESIPKQVGALSLVVPNFASQRTLYSKAALFQLKENGEWSRVPIETLKPEKRQKGLAWLIDILKKIAHLDI